MCFFHYFDKCTLIIIIYGNVSQYANKHTAIFYEINEILEENCLLNLSQLLEKNINFCCKFCITFNPLDLILCGILLLIFFAYCLYSLLENKDHENTFASLHTHCTCYAELYI